MGLTDVLQLIGGLSLFLFGMTVMGHALERRAGNELRKVLGQLTSGRFMGLLTGLAVTAIIQSSSATTVMVVGFVNSGLMNLSQAINVIMGANIGTTVTSWILSLAGIESSNFFISMLKPTNFTPILALIGIIYIMSSKSGKKNDTGTILLGFATLMYGMESMAQAVAGLRYVPAFQNLFLKFSNPLLGLLAGAILTAIIQSSSASVGILQALASTGQVSYGAAIPIIMGQNIGTCITAILSSVGANKNAKRAAMIHLSFNVIGAGVLLSVFTLVKHFFQPALLNESASLFGIAIAHSAFNFLATLIIFPLGKQLEKLANHLVPESKNPQEVTELDERLLSTPSIALQQCRSIMVEMLEDAALSLRKSLDLLFNYNEEEAQLVHQLEAKTDHYEDILGSYLVKLSSRQISAQDSAEAAEYLKLIGDFERIADHSMNILSSAEEIQKKKLDFTPTAKHELEILVKAVEESMDVASTAFIHSDLASAHRVEPLEEVIDRLKDRMRTRHIKRLQRGECSIEVGFVWSDLLTNLERVSDHCSNIAACVMDMAQSNMNLHESLRLVRSEDPSFKEDYARYAEKYALPPSTPSPAPAEALSLS